jgi:hypothetical protein
VTPKAEFRHPIWRIVSPIALVGPGVVLYIVDRVYFPVCSLVSGPVPPSGRVCGVSPLAEALSLILSLVGALLALALWVSIPARRANDAMR